MCQLGGAEFKYGLMFQIVSELFAGENRWWIHEVWSEFSRTLCWVQILWEAARSHSTSLRTDIHVSCRVISGLHVWRRSIRFIFNLTSAEPSCIKLNISKMQILVKRSVSPFWYRVVPVLHLDLISCLHTTMIQVINSQSNLQLQAHVCPVPHTRKHKEVLRRNSTVPCCATPRPAADTAAEDAFAPWIMLTVYLPSLHLDREGTH